MKNNFAGEKIIKILKENRSDKNELIREVLNEELKDIKIRQNTLITYCNCGFPLYVEENQESILINEITKQDVDFRSYREFIYCPNCDCLLNEIQH